jgi:hypothetical protein
LNSPGSEGGTMTPIEIRESLRPRMAALGIQPLSYPGS